MITKQGIAKQWKHPLSRSRGGVIWLVILLIVSGILLLALRNDLTVRKVELSTTKVTERIRFVFLSDLHSCMYGEGQRELIKRIESQHPDFILLGGDIADDVIAHDNTRLLLEGIAGRYPCYYVSGNHEYWSGEISAIKEMIRDFGVLVLEGENRTLPAHGQQVVLCGVDDFEIGAEAFEWQLKNATDNRDVSNYSILLTHRPEQIERYLKHKPDLVLAGHAHGGQWRIPWISDGLYAPDQGFFPKYTAGPYLFDETTMLVSRGLARETTRIPRIFNPPEIIVIDIVPEQDT